MKPITLIPIPPIDYLALPRPLIATKQQANIDGTNAEIAIYELPVYPYSPNGFTLHNIRVDTPTLSLRDAATKLGLSTSELSGLEQGRLTSDAQGWIEIFNRMAGITEGAEDMPETL